MDFVPMWVVSGEPCIQRDCSQVYSAAILLCAARLLMTLHEAGRVKAVFKGFWRWHLNPLYLSAFPLTSVNKHFFPLFLCSPKLCTCYSQQQQYSTRFVVINV